MSEELKDCGFCHSQVKKVTEYPDYAGPVWGGPPTETIDLCEFCLTLPTSFMRGDFNNARLLAIGMNFLSDKIEKTLRKQVE